MCRSLVVTERVRLDLRVLTVAVSMRPHVRAQPRPRSGYPSASAGPYPLGSFVFVRVVVSWSRTPMGSAIDVTTRGYRVGWACGVRGGWRRRAPRVRRGDE